MLTFPVLVTNYFGLCTSYIRFPCCLPSCTQLHYQHNTHVLSPTMLAIHHVLQVDGACATYCDETGHQYHSKRNWEGSG